MSKAPKQPSGRPPALRREVLRATAGGRELVEIVVAIARDASAPIRDRMQAVEWLATYAWPEGRDRRAALSQSEPELPEAIALGLATVS